MSLPFDTRDLMAEARQNLATGAEETGFTENLFSAFDQFRNENLSVSQNREFGVHWNEQYELAKQHGFETPSDIGMQADEEFIHEAAKRPGLSLPVYWIEKRDRKFAELQKQFPDAGFKLSGDLWQDMTERLARERDQAENIRGRASTTGAIGAFLGDLAGATSDPLVLLTLPFGAANSATILRTVLTEAAIGSATEAAIQPAVFEFKDAINSPYSMSEAVSNVGLAGLGAGAFAGILKTIPYAYKPLLEKYREQRRAGGLPEPTEAERTAEAFLERYTQEMETNPFDPELPESIELHAENLRTADERVANGEFVPETQLRNPEIAQKPDPYGEIPRGSNLDLGAREIESDFAAYINRDIEKAIADYDKLAEAEGGKIINTDVARELSPAYRADRSRSAAVHEPASYLVKRVFAKRLAEAPKEGELPVVVFSGGGTGAGKTTGLQKAPVAKQAQVIYDNNLSNFNSAVSKIDQALAAGKDIGIIYTWRDPLESFVQGALPRAMRMGRTVPLLEHAKTHVGAARVIKELAEHYRDNPKVSINVIDNSRGKGKAQLADLSIIPELDYNKLVRSLNDALEAEKQAGRISESVYSGTRQRGPENPDEPRSVLSEVEQVGRRNLKQKRRLNFRQLEAQADRLHKNPALLDDALEAETARILEQRPDLAVPVDERIDPATGETSVVTMTARDLLRQADEERAAADAFRECTIGAAA